MYAGNKVAWHCRNSALVNRWNNTLSPWYSSILRTMFRQCKRLLFQMVPAMSNPSLSELVVNAFIAAFLIFSWTWNLPEDSLLKRIGSLVSPPFLMIGLAHTWQMFTPNPMGVNYRLLVDIHVGNSQIVRWHPPRFDRIGVVQAFFRNREIKLYENLISNRFPFLKAEFSNYAAAWARDRGYRPTRVDFIVYGESIPKFKSDESLPFEPRTIYTHSLIDEETDPSPTNNDSLQNAGQEAQTV